MQITKYMPAREILCEVPEYPEQGSWPDPFVHVPHEKQTQDGPAHAMIPRLDRAKSTIKPNLAWEKLMLPPPAGRLAALEGLRRPENPLAR